MAGERSLFPPSIWLNLFFLLALGGATCATALAQEPPEGQPPPEEQPPPETEPPEEEEPPPDMELREGFLVPKEEGAAEDEAGTEDDSGRWSFSLTETLNESVDFLSVSGRLSTRFRARWAGNEDDYDLYATLSLDFGDRNLSSVTGHVMVRGSQDLDGDSGHDGYYPFDSIEDTYDHATNGRLYYGYLDFHRIPDVGLLRVGRQQVYETPELAWFDGARVETKEIGELRFRLGGYAGIPVHLYESSTHGDFLAGTYGEARPWQGGRVRADWMVAWDDTRTDDHRDNIMGLSLWQSFGEMLEVYGYYSRLEGDERDLRLRATYTDVDLDLRVRASYVALLQKQKNFALEFDPYYTTLLEYEPYNQWSLLVSKGVGEKLVVDGGADFRQLQDDDDEGAYNHEFERYYLTPTVSNIPWDGLSVSMTGELWYSNDDNDIRTLGFDATQEIDEQWSATVGTYYSLFKYEYLTVRERDDVRTYYVRFEYDWSRDLRFHAQYEYEDDDFDEFSTVKVGAIWSF